jgi:pSer/pThr/pTyr-binding forkhead associated (FHA) protein/Mg-chelatase subunit ChlD
MQAITLDRDRQFVETVVSRAPHSVQNTALPLPRRVVTVFGIACFAGLVLIHVAWGSSSSAPMIDVIAILDNSGSMRQNDPSGLMKGAVLNFAGHLPDTTRLGIVVFDKTARLVLPLTQTGEPAFQLGVNTAVRTIDYSGQRTDIPGAIESALYELHLRGRSGARHVIVLFTDGYIDLGNEGKDIDRAQWLTTDLVAEAQKNNVSIYGIAFTDQADFQLLQSLSQETGGQYFRVQRPADIDGVFATIAAQLETSAQVASSIPGPSGANVAASSFPWKWVAAAAIAVLATVACQFILRRRRSLPVIAVLQDVGLHTSLPVSTINKPSFRIGNLKRPKWNITNDIVIPYPTVSRMHAEISFHDDKFLLRDLRSKNHTFLNGKRLQDDEALELHHGDSLRFDAYEFLFLSGDKQASLSSARSVMTMPSVPSPPESGRPDSEAIGGGVFQGTQPPGDRIARKTAVKPSGSSDHPETPCYPECPICGKPLRPDYTENWNGNRICSACMTDIITNADPERARQIAGALRKEVRTQRKPN